MKGRTYKRAFISLSKHHRDVVKVRKYKKCIRLRKETKLTSKKILDA